MTTGRELNAGLVHVRTPAYKRPELLKRCLESLQAQTWENWVCDVFDDDADQVARTVCEAMGDARIHYTPNPKQLFASANIDQCFTRRNPRDADYFCVAEDDNFHLPRFMEDNIALIRQGQAEIVMRNQKVEFGTGTPEARLSTHGILEGVYRDGLTPGGVVRLGLIPGIGVSNGGVFWSRHARTDLEMGPCGAALQEYMRTFSICEPVHIALEPLAVWAENGEGTTRNLGDGSAYLRRELNFKRGIQVLQRHVWSTTPRERRTAFLAGRLLAASPERISFHLAKALVPKTAEGGPLPMKHRVNLLARGLLIAVGGRTDRDFAEFMAIRIPTLKD